MPGRSAGMRSARASAHPGLARTPALHVKRLVDRLVADAHALVIRVVEPQTLSDLLRAPRPRPASALPRPVSASLPGHGRPRHRSAARSDDGRSEPFPYIGPQRRTPRELRPLRTARRPFRMPRRGGGPVIQVAAPRRRVAPQLARDRRCRPSRATCDLPHAKTSRPPQRDLLPFGKRQVPPRERLRRAGRMRRCHPTRLSEPAGSERRRHPNRHRRVLTRQTLGDERPEPTPMLLPRYRRPPPETSTFPAKLDPSTADPPSHHPSTPLLRRPCESAQWALASDLVSRLPNATLVTNLPRLSLTPQAA